MATVVNEPLSRHALAFVLAGGRGSRLLELTDRRAKPAVYFGGKSRIIDFALSNAVNSGIRRIAVATQYAFGGDAGLPYAMAFVPLPSVVLGAVMCWHGMKHFDSLRHRQNNEAKDS